MILQAANTMLEKLKSSIGTPYIKYIEGGTHGVVEYGYCVVDKETRVKEKTTLGGMFNDFIIPSNIGDININMDMTNDGYLRLWTDNTNYYLRWLVGSKDNYVKLMAERRGD